MPCGDFAANAQDEGEPLPTLDEWDSLGTAAILMAEKQMNRVYVTNEGGRPVGVVTLANVVRHIFDLNETSPEADDTDQASTKKAAGSIQKFSNSNMGSPESPFLRALPVPDVSPEASPLVSRPPSGRPSSSGGRNSRPGSSNRTGARQTITPAHRKPRKLVKQVARGRVG